MHRLLRVFPHICKNHIPLCGSIAATYRIANLTLAFLGRRCKAPSIVPGYILFALRTLYVSRSHLLSLFPYLWVSTFELRDLTGRSSILNMRSYALCLSSRYIVDETEKQATFTGAEQRAGVAILAFVVQELFGRGRRRRTERQRASSCPSKRSKASSRASLSNSDDASGEFMFRAILDKDDDEPLPSNFEFDWVAYHARSGDTPMEDAVTAIFAEYAVLYGRIAGWITSSTPKLLTVSEAKDIAQHAEDFFVKFITPILAAVQTPKIRKLLRHVFDAINLQGNLQNANTGGNEAGHKLDRPFYRRTNKTFAEFTHQIVRQAQGSRAVLKRNSALDANGVSGADAAGPRAPVGAAMAAGGGESPCGSLGGAPGATNTAVGGGGPPRRRLGGAAGGAGAAVGGGAAGPRPAVRPGGAARRAGSPRRPVRNVPGAAHVALGGGGSPCSLLSGASIGTGAAVGGGGSPRRLLGGAPVGAGAALGGGGSPRCPLGGALGGPGAAVKDGAADPLLGRVALGAVAGRPIVPSAVLPVGLVQRWVEMRRVLVLLLGLVVLPSAVRLVGLVHRLMSTRVVVGRVTVRHVDAVGLRAEVRRRTVGVVLTLWRALAHGG